MTRLDQALRWWSNRKCECRPGEFVGVHSKMVRITTISSRNWDLLHRTGQLKKLMRGVGFPGYYHLKNDPTKHSTP